ncbi:MAG: exodeoxyribonuclease VII small subunit [Agathobacter sp.]|nr:exodeoxyribonuclease VII small subunit [Agathobacter sp.]
MSEENKVTLEERFSRLEGIIEQMEDAESTLDASFELYKQGLTEIKAANEMLDNIEKAMMVINQNGELEEF